MNNTCILCPQFFDWYSIRRKTVDTEYTYYSWCMTSSDIVKWRKNEWLWKFWKRNDLYENFEKRGGSREKGGRRKRNPCPMRLCKYLILVLTNDINRKRIQKGQSKMDNPEKHKTNTTKQNHSTICVRHYSTQTNTNNVNKTWAPTNN